MRTSITSPLRHYFFISLCFPKLLPSIVHSVNLGNDWLFRRSGSPYVHFDRVRFDRVSSPIGRVLKARIELNSVLVGCCLSRSLSTTVCTTVSFSP